MLANRLRLIQISLVCLIAAVAVVLGSHFARSEDAPPSYVASPDVYKLLQQNERFRIIEATWKPGQRDNFHSHWANAVYHLTDCTERIYLPDGKFTDSSHKAGSTALQNPIPSHSFENRSTAECRSVIVAAR